MLGPKCIAGFWDGHSATVVGARLTVSGVRFREREEGPPSVLVLPMDWFIFRLVDVQSGDKRALAAQFQQFLPVSSSDVYWQSYPVQDKTLILAVRRDRLDALLEKVSTQKNIVVIPALIAACLEFSWGRDEPGWLAVPFKGGYVRAYAEKGHLNSFMVQTALDEDTVCCHSPENLAKGGVLFKLLGHSYKRPVYGSWNKVSGLQKVGILSALLFLLAAGFWGYGQHRAQSSQMKLLDRRISEVRPEVKEIQNIVQRNERMGRTIDFLRETNSRYVSPYLVFADLNSRLPDNTFLFDVWIETKKGRISGVSTDVTGFLEVLSSIDYIRTARLASPLVRDKEGNERFEIEFEL